ncbi:MAG: antitoxin Xre/MbcA/ParS toxin-binding domain-containing protein [Thermomicrobiales bacterium]
MAVGVKITATPELEAVVPTIDDTLGRLQDRLNALPPTDVVAVVEAAVRALTPVETETSALVAALTAGRTTTPEERVEAEMDVLRRSFVRRRELLADTLSTSQVAALLNTSRQTPHDRVASGTLLAVMDRGGLRFPQWQFDPRGDDGVVTGLPTVLRALDVSPLAKMSWLTRPNPMLDGQTPLACLKSGHLEQVVALARAVSVA